jgi:hypothetical protein
VRGAAELAGKKTFPTLLSAIEITEIARQRKTERGGNPLRAGLGSSHPRIVLTACDIEQYIQVPRDPQYRVQGSRVDRGQKHYAANVARAALARFKLGLNWVALPTEAGTSLLSNFSGLSD